MNDTPKRIFIDSGIVYTNYGFSNQRELGETKGGSIFEVEVEFRQVEADGQKGRTKGMKRKIREDAAITANILNLSMENLKLALPGAIVTSDKLKSGWKVEMSEYLNNVTIIGETLEGKLVKLTVYNAMTEDGLNIPLVDKEESAVSLKFWAHHVGGEDLWDIEEIDSIDDNPVDPVDPVNPSTVNLQPLHDEVNRINIHYQQVDYTPESWVIIQSALSNAENVLYHMAQPTQMDVNSAINGLASAENQLIWDDNGGYTQTIQDIQMEINSINSQYHESDYTPESWAIMQSALDQADYVLNNIAMPTQMDIDSAISGLASARDQLVLI